MGTHHFVLLAAVLAGPRVQDAFDDLLRHRARLLPTGALAGAAQVRRRSSGSQSQLTQLTADRLLRWTSSSA